MKALVISIYIFGFISALTLWTSLQNWSQFHDICVGILTGALTTLCLSLINYWHAKENIRRDVCLKLVAIYTILVNINKKIQQNNINALSSNDDIKNVILEYNEWYKHLKENSLSNELATYYSLNSPKCIKWFHVTKENKYFNALWDVEQNIINGISITASKLNIIKIRLDIAHNKQLMGLSDENVDQYRLEFFVHYFHLADVIPQQITFMDKLLDYLCNKKIFHNTWTEHKKQYIPQE